MMLSVRCKYLSGLVTESAKCITGSEARSASTTMYSIARAWICDKKGESANEFLEFTCLVSINQLVETIAGMAQLKEHICIFDVIANLFIDDSGTIYEPWTTCQWRIWLVSFKNEPLRADRRCNVTCDLCIASNVIKSSKAMKGAGFGSARATHLSTSIPFLLFATISNKNSFSWGWLLLEI